MMSSGNRKSVNFPEAREIKRHCLLMQAPRDSRINWMETERAVGKPTMSNILSGI